MPRYSDESAYRAEIIDPFGDLRDVLERVCTHPARKVAELLPDRWQANRSGAGLALSR